MPALALQLRDLHLAVDLEPDLARPWLKDVEGAPAQQQVVVLRFLPRLGVELFVEAGLDGAGASPLPKTRSCSVGRPSALATSNGAW